MDSRLEEMRLEEARRKPLTSAQMIRFHFGPEGKRPNRKDLILTATGKGLIALGQWLLPKNESVFKEKVHN